MLKKDTVFKSTMTSDQLSTILMQSVALGTLLIEKFEIMEENRLTAFKAKQSLKATLGYLETYVNKVFRIPPTDEEEVAHMKKGATHVSELVRRVEISLNTPNILGISERKQDLMEMIEETSLTKEEKKALYEKIRDSGIIDY